MRCSSPAVGRSSRRLALEQLAVDALDLVGAADAEQAREQLLRLELEVDRAARRAARARRSPSRNVAEAAAPCAAEREQRAHAVEEHAVVADEVDDRRRALLPAARAEAAAELLEEDDARLGRAEHHDAVDRRDVDALVEDVDRADGVELAALRASRARRSRSSEPSPE